MIVGVSLLQFNVATRGLVLNGVLSPDQENPSIARVVCGRKTSNHSTSEAPPDADKAACLLNTARVECIRYIYSTSDHGSAVPNTTIEMVMIRQSGGVHWCSIYTYADAQERRYFFISGSRWQVAVVSKCSLSFRCSVSDMIQVSGSKTQGTALTLQRLLWYIMFCALRNRKSVKHGPIALFPQIRATINQRWLKLDLVQNKPCFCDVGRCHIEGDCFHSSNTNTQAALKWHR